MINLFLDPWVTLHFAALSTFSVSLLLIFFHLKYLGVYICSSILRKYFHLWVEKCVPQKFFAVKILLLKGRGGMKGIRIEWDIADKGSHDKSRYIFLFCSNTMHPHPRLTPSWCQFKGGGDTRLIFFMLQSNIFRVFSKRFVKCCYNWFLYCCIWADMCPVYNKWNVRYLLLDIVTVEARVSIVFSYLWIGHSKHLWMERPFYNCPLQNLTMYDAGYIVIVFYQKNPNFGYFSTFFTYAV